MREQRGVISYSPRCLSVCVSPVKQCQINLDRPQPPPLILFRPMGILPFCTAAPRCACPPRESRPSPVPAEKDIIRPPPALKICALPVSENGITRPPSSENGIARHQHHLGKAWVNDPDGEGRHQHGQESSPPGRLKAEGIIISGRAAPAWTRVVTSRTAEG